MKAVGSNEFISQYEESEVTSMGAKRDYYEVLGISPVSYTHLTLPTNREV